MKYPGPFVKRLLGLVDGKPETYLAWHRQIEEEVEKMIFELRQHIGFRKWVFCNVVWWCYKLAEDV